MPDVDKSARGGHRADTPRDVPGVRQRDPERPFVISIHCSDFHLWDTPPSFRADEPDWWKAQLRPIEQIKALQTKYGGVPIVFGGDLFDRYKPSPELLNFALKHLPVMYGIAGNHDLPNHRYDDIHKSGYWTMVEAGRLIDLKPGEPYPLNGLTLHGYPFGTPVKSIASHMIDGFNVAVIHQYVWRGGHGYVGAPEDRKAAQVQRGLGNFSHAFYGDNHAAFTYATEDLFLVNTGCIIRRRRDEADYAPSVWLLWSDGEVSRKKLDCSRDVYSQVETKESVGKGESIDPERLIASLRGLQQKNRIDFQATVEQILEASSLDQTVREKVMEAINEGK